jgi:hypothetical protein
MTVSRVVFLVCVVAFVVQPGRLVNAQSPTDHESPSQPFGNAPRNSVRGPNYWTFDFAVIKQVGPAGAARVQLRLAASNLFNRINYTAPNGNRSQAAFGTITSTYDPRQMQLGVKVLW